MSTTFSVSRDDVIVAAFQVCGTYDVTNPPGSAAMSQAAIFFNVMIKSWIKTVPMWKVEIVTLPLLTGQNTYQIGPYAVGTGSLVVDKILRVQYAEVRDNTNASQPFDTPIDQLSIQEYEQYGAKNSLGVVNGMLYRPLDDTPSPAVSSYIQVYPTPADSFHSLRMVCLTQLNDVNIGTDPLDFPQECYLALIYNLANHLSLPSAVPLDRVREIAQRAKATYDEMADWSQENAESIRFMYDNRGR